MTDALQAQLIRLETALARRDPTGIRGGSDGLVALIPDDFLEFGASGRTWTARDVRATLRDDAPREVEIEDFAVTRLADDVALVTYRSRDPRPAKRSSVWVRRDGGWVLRFHQGTLVP
jgi:hypothetical protein